MKLKKFNIYKIFVMLLLVSATLFYACNQEEDEIYQSEVQNEQAIEKPDYIIGLGKKLENPYTVENMRKAYQNLLLKKKSNFTKSGESKIQTTDYYVRFLPKDDQEKEILQEEDKLMLFDMPLDYELEEGVGGAYLDPTLPIDQITWQYTVVPVDYQFRDIQFEKLANLFLQDEDDEKNARKSALGTNLWYALEDEALRITGNEDDIVNEKASMLRRGRKWYPSGTIRYEDITLPLQE